MRKRTEVYAVGLADMQAAHERAAQLNEEPPPKWVAGSFRAQSQRSHQGHRTWTVVGDRDLLWRRE